MAVAQLYLQRRTVSERRKQPRPRYNNTDLKARQFFSCWSLDSTDEVDTVEPYSRGLCELRKWNASESESKESPGLSGPRARFEQLTSSCAYYFLNSDTRLSFADHVYPCLQQPQYPKSKCSVQNSASEPRPGPSQNQRRPLLNFSKVQTQPFLYDLPKNTFLFQALVV